RLKEDHGDSLFVGAGTVRTAADVTAALAAGADFLVSPQFTADLGTAAAERDSALIPGVFTPREAELAHRAGFSLQKLFPAGSGGPAHLRALLGPYPHLSFIPTGGVNPDNAAAYFRAGAVAVGIGTGLFAPGADAETLRAGLSTVLQAAREGGAQ
ncbi:MAG TPA: 2-dehydro-3-deoxyphosphogluconate aldolase, partial [Deinococcales bacterium]|nr:2-dehydro-3-deoxyphosphogluconate aldolase [Deinococcales bacterium]